MTKLKSTLIKLCSIVLAVCAAFAIATISQAKTVDAAESASFKVNGASIYKYDGEDDGKIGLRFEAEFNDAWLEDNTADTYTFGIIVSPTAKFTAWDDNNKKIAENVSAVDGINFIRIKNAPVTKGQIIYAGILFDDDSLKAAIAEYKGVEATTIDQSEVDALRENFYNQSYTAVAYASYGSEVIYSEKFATTMRETAAKTYALGVAEDNADYKARALPYLQVEESNVANQTAYVLASDKKVVVDSAEYTATEGSTMLVAMDEGKPKILAEGADKDYTIENGSIVLAKTKASKTVETVVVIDEGEINVAEISYVDVALSNAQEVAEYFALDEEASSNDLSAVLTQDIDMSGILLSNYTDFNYNGSFDGRGHVLTNVTLDLKNGDVDKTTYGLFGNVKDTAVIKNVAFSDIRSTDHQTNSAVFGYSFEGSLENVYVSYSIDNKSTSGLFVTVGSGIMKNVVIVDNYDNSAFDKDAYIEDYKSAWGVSPLSRTLGKNSSTFENVQVISRRPLVYFSEDENNFDVTYNATVAGSPATVNDWGARFGYAENETELWYEFEYFYRSATDEVQSGLGLTEGTANVERTKETGKTIVKTGIRRYDDMSAFLADANNATNREKLLATGFWKEVEGDIVWANNANISEQGKYVDEVDYDASTGILYSTAWNGEKVSYVILDGAVLTAEENGGLVLDGDNNIVGVRAKFNASDKLPGIDYKTSGYNSNVINYEGKLSICVNNKVYNIRKLNYYTQLIFNMEDLREALGSEVDYTIVNHGTADVETDREKTLNGKGFMVYTTLSSSNYYEGVYNVGIYKMMADVDMNKEEIDYKYNTLVSGSQIGGFVGYFDGNGYAIDNLRSARQGIFGRVGVYVAGKIVGDTSSPRYVNYNPVIKNLAITNVITSVYNESSYSRTPILATLLGVEAAEVDIVGYDVKVNNLFVTVSTTDSTGAGSFVTKIGARALIDNIYLVNQNEFNMVERDELAFRTTDVDRADIKPENGVKIYNIFSNINSSSYTNATEGVLFGSLSTLTSTYAADKAILTNITNTYVTTTMPLNYYTTNAPVRWSYSRYAISFSVENGAVIGANATQPVYKLGKIGTSAATISAVYGSNETVGNIPAIYGLKQSEIDDVKYHMSPKADGGLGLAAPEKSGKSGVMCDVCGEVAHSVNARPIKDKACQSTEGCTGTYKAAIDYSGNTLGYFISSPCMYTFTYHTGTEMGAKYASTNGAWKLSGVRRHYTTEAMKADTNNDFSSFTGETGNGMWEVVETQDDEGNTLRELKWVGRVA